MHSSFNICPNPPFSPVLTPECCVHCVVTMPLAFLCWWCLLPSSSLCSIAPVSSKAFCQCPHPLGSPQSWWFPLWAPWSSTGPIFMIALCGVLLGSLQGCVCSAKQIFLPHAHGCMLSLMSVCMVSEWVCYVYNLLVWGKTRRK